MPWNPRSIALSCALSSPTSRPRHDWSGGDVPNLPLWPLQSAINIPVIKIQVSLFLALSRSFSLYLTHSLSLPPSLSPSLLERRLERLHLSLCANSMHGRPRTRARPPTSFRGNAGGHTLITLFGLMSHTGFSRGFFEGFE